MINWTSIFTELNFAAVRSRGPGGQNVNKVSSSAQLHWNFGLSPNLTDFQKQLLREKLSTRINSRGEIYLRSDEFRDYPRNVDRCREKLEELVREALHRPKPRRATRPTKGSKVRNRKAKSLRSDIKKSRQKWRD